MKRLVVVAVVLALVVGVALPPLFGARARAIVDADLAAIREAVAPYGTLDVTFEEWDIGWYSSTASVSVELGLGDHPGLPPGVGDLPAFTGTFPELATLHHGPILTQPSVGLGWGGVELAIDAATIPELRSFQDATGIDHVLVVAMRVGFLGGASLGMEVPAFVYEGQDVRFDFQGFEFDATVDGGGQRVDHDGEIGGFGVSEPGSEILTVNRIDWSGTAWQDSRIHHLWLGDGRLDIDRVAVGGDGVPVAFDVSDIAVEGGIETDGDSYVIAGSVEVDEVRIADRQLNDLVARMTMRCGPETMARLWESPYDMGALDPDARAALAAAILRERFSFEMDRFGFEHEDRSASASLAFEYRGDELPDEVELGTTVDFAVVAPVVSAKVDMVFHKDLVPGLGIDRLDALVRALARDGILQESDDDYTLDVGLESGSLTLNGQPFEPWDLLPLLSGLNP